MFQRHLKAQTFYAYRYHFRFNARDQTFIHFQTCQLRLKGHVYANISAEGHTLASILRSCGRHLVQTDSTLMTPNTARMLLYCCVQN